MTEVCRCGYVDNGGPHPCHGTAYTCQKPAKFRLYNARPVPLAGMNLKFGADGTWACDECWAGFEKLLEARGAYVR
jgi:hypothetical protein